MDHLKTKLRTHTCNSLTESDIDKEVKLIGWVDSIRDHGGVIFIDLRDRYGKTQLVFDPSFNKKTYDIAERLGKEYVINIKGIVKARSQDRINPKLDTGKIEVFVNEIKIESKSEILPFEIDSRINVNEETRLKYRFLDLRRDFMKDNLIIRSKAANIVRNYFNKLGFVEVETPFLTKSTPEGARDFLVPSRIHPGKFYALPQSPQIFKQILMLSGLDRYFQIVKCFRDEDLRADRQPEFTQIDVEMSFVDVDDVKKVNENMIKEVFKQILDIEFKEDFPVITYEYAMEHYASDKPDLRYDLKMFSVNDIVADSDFKVFVDIVNSNGLVKAMRINKDLPRKDIDSLINYVQEIGGKGMAWMRFRNNKLESSITKYFNEETLNKLIQRIQPQDNSVIVFIADKDHKKVNFIIDNLRREIAKRYNLYEKEFAFVWVVDFPMFEYSETDQRFTAMHHPFTSPTDEFIDLILSKSHQELNELRQNQEFMEKIKAKAYDLVLNGYELGGGSIRIHNSKLQSRIFTLLGISKEEAEQKFGFLLNAFKYGAPPHGGIAFGFDRLIMLLTKNTSIKEVIAFPKNKLGVSLLDDAPSFVDEKQLKELHIQVIHNEKEKNKENK